MPQYFKMFLLISGIALTAAACGPSNNPCDGFSCEDGFSCLLESGTPTCIPDGNGGNGGSGQAGDQCETKSDCQTPLVCLADLNGDLVCTTPP